MSYELDEQILIQATRRGDLQAFNLLIDRYQDLLFSIALRILGDEDSAADAAQVAWISAYRKINGFRGSCLRIWLVRVVVNACYDELRRRHRRREVPLLGINADGEEIEAVPWLVDPAPGVEEIMEKEEFEKVMNECLQSLTLVYRTMLVLVDIEGMSYEEAASAAGVPLGTVRSRMARARMALRQRLQETADLAPSRQRFQVLTPKQAE
jgi:RNA polymerase sigma-70 factor, ECF subfamily